MSFILDALKKSESDRQRQGGPALFEVKVAAPRNPLPPWAVAIAVLFVANLGVVGWLLLRHAATPAETPASARVAEHAAAAPAPAAAAPAAPATTAPAAVASTAPAALPATTGPATRSASSRPEPAPTAAAAEPGTSSEDDAPAEEPPAPAGLGRVKRGTDAGVPLYQQLASAPGSRVPQLRLDLHAYAERAADRWVLVNMHKLHEGDSLEGVRVERITPEGAVLSYQGSQFLLTRE